MGMKRVCLFFFASSFLFTSVSIAQDCVIQKETDPYTKQVKLTTGFIKLRNASLSIQADSKEIDFFFVLTGNEKCFTDASNASVFFEGTKAKTNFRNGGSMNCDGYFHFIFRNQPILPSALQKLATQKVTNILFTGNDKKETQLTFSPEHQEALMHMVSCLIAEAKTLQPKQ
jgi:hypothetical protein